MINNDACRYYLYVSFVKNCSSIKFVSVPIFDRIYKLVWFHVIFVKCGY